MALLYKSTPERGAVWKAIFAEHAPHVEFRTWPDVGDPAKIRYLAAWQLPPDIAFNLPNLEVIFSVGAGIDQFHLGSIPNHVQVIRMIEPLLSKGMAEYVALATLALHRNLVDYLAAQRDRRWDPRPSVPAAERRVSIMGLGTMGQAAIEALRPFGFQLAGWSRSMHAIDGVQCFYGTNALGPFLGQTDILVCLLPLTPQTRGILCRETFNRLPRGSSLISAARGGHLVEQDLLASLADGQVSAAMLDVAAEEPLPPDHPFWSHPRILITPHIASSTSAESGGRALLENVLRHQRGEPMLGAVQKTLGY